MSLTTLTLTTMEEMKSEGTSHIPWQGYRVPLPMPPRLPQSYETAAPPSSSMILPYHGLPKTNQSASIPPQAIPVSRSKDSYPSAPRAGLTSHHSYPSLKRPYESYDDASYSDNVPEMYEGLPEADTGSKPSIQPDHQLLSFATLPDRHTVLDHYGRASTVEIAAQIHGMFFLSEISKNAGENVIVQPELTCYRRNLFQVSGSVTSPTGPLSVLNERGEASPIVSQEISISAMESVDGHIIRLIVIPWKTPPPNSPEVPPNQEQEPSPIPLVYSGDSNQERTSDLTVQPIAWRRLQFRVATANNGRRKELQQHFLLRLKLTATTADGSKIIISEATTAPIVVRGRSPRNFQARKEIPLVGASASPRGQSSQVSPVERKSIGGTEKARPQKLEHLEFPKRQYQFDASTFPPSPLMVRPGYSQWNPSQQQPDHSPSATTPTYPSHQGPPVFSDSVHAISDVARMPTQPVLASQVSRGEAPSSRPPYYQSGPPPGPGNMPLQYMDNNPRPAKSPRHGVPPELSSMPMYPQYDERGVPTSQYPPPVNGHPVSSREYFPSTVPQDSWPGSSDHASVTYGSAPMPPPLQQQHQHQHQPHQPHPSQQQQQPQPQSQPYPFPSEAYPKEQSQQTHYQWSTA